MFCSYSLSKPPVSARCKLSVQAFDSPRDAWCCRVICAAKMKVLPLALALALAMVYGKDEVQHLRGESKDKAEEEDALGKVGAVAKEVAPKSKEDESPKLAGGEEGAGAKEAAAKSKEDESTKAGGEEGSVAKEAATKSKEDESPKAGGEVGVVAKEPQPQPKNGENKVPAFKGSAFTKEAEEPRLSAQDFC